MVLHVPSAAEIDIQTLLDRLTEDRAGYLDNINNDELLGVPDISVMEHEIEFPFAEDDWLDEIAAIGDQPTTERPVTVSLPAGANIVRAMLVAVVTAMNNSANAQKIGFTVQMRKGAGSWNSYFSETDCMGMDAVDGATANLVALQDITDLVDQDTDYGARLIVNQSSANSVRYTAEFLLVVTYRMS